MIAQIIVVSVIFLLVVFLLLPWITVWFEIKHKPEEPKHKVVETARGTILKINKPREIQVLEFAEMASIAQKQNGHECPKCYGRGYESWHSELEQFVPCICVIKVANKARLQKKTEKTGAMN